MLQKARHLGVTPVVHSWDEDNMTIIMEYVSNVRVHDLYNTSPSRRQGVQWHSIERQPHCQQERRLKCCEILESIQTYSILWCETYAVLLESKFLRNSCNSLTFLHPTQDSLPFVWGNLQESNRGNRKEREGSFVQPRTHAALPPHTCTTNPTMTSDDESYTVPSKQAISLPTLSVSAVSIDMRNDQKHSNNCKTVRINGLLR